MVTASSGPRIGARSLYDVFSVRKVTCLPCVVMNQKCGLVSIFEKQLPIANENNWTRPMHRKKQKT